MVVAVEFSRESTGQGASQNTRDKIRMLGRLDVGGLLQEGCHHARISLLARPNPWTRLLTHRDVAQLFRWLYP